MINFVLIFPLLAFINKIKPISNSYTDNIGITISWTDNTVSTDFVMSINSLNSGKYFAFGLSNDNSMVIRLVLFYLFENQKFEIFRKTFKYLLSLHS